MGRTFSTALPEAQEAGPLFWNANKLPQPWDHFAAQTIVESLSAGSSVLETSVLLNMQSSSGAPVLFYRSRFVLL